MGHPQILRFWLRQNDEQEQTETKIPGLRSETWGTRLFGWRHVAAGEGEEGGEVGLGVVAVGMLAEGEVAGNDSGADCGEVLDGAGVVGERLFTEELVDGAGGELGDEGAADVGPAVASLEVPPPMKTGRGAQRAMSSCISTGMSAGVTSLGEASAYFR